MTQTFRDWERHLLSLLGLVLLGLSTWTLNKTATTGELVSSQTAQIQSLKSEVSRIQGRVEARYTAAAAAQDYQAIGARLELIERRLMRIEDQAGGFQRWQESRDPS